MKYLAILLVTISVSGCDTYRSEGQQKFSLFESSIGTIYLLNTTTGKTEVISSKRPYPELINGQIYRSAEGKRYKYMNGKIKQTRRSIFDYHINRDSNGKKKSQ